MDAQLYTTVVVHSTRSSALYIIPYSRYLSLFLEPRSQWDASEIYAIVATSDTTSSATIVAVNQIDSIVLGRWTRHSPTKNE